MFDDWSICEPIGVPVINDHLRPSPYLEVGLISEAALRCDLRGTRQPLATRGLRTLFGYLSSKPWVSKAKSEAYLLAVYSWIVPAYIRESRDI